jgi:pimeloyl-ACP methyl ester carboxylesterase
VISLAKRHAYNGGVCKRGQRMRWLFLWCALLLAACGGKVLRPDLARLYEASTGAPTQPPVVLIHGVLGAKLRHKGSGVEVWPGSLARLAFSEFRELELGGGDDDLEPFALFDAAAGQDFYGAIVRTLMGPGGYAQGVIGTPPGDQRKRVYVFLYDWRRDNVDSVRALDAYVESIRRDYGDPKLRVDLVAHSNGGLIARYYLRYGMTDVCDDNEFPISDEGAEKVRRLVLLGTPNFGSVRTVMGLIEGAKVGFRRIPPEVLASFPSAYQLFPHALNQWLVTVDGTTLDRDLFDIELWRRFQWSIFDPEVRARIAREHAHPDTYLATLEAQMARSLERARRFTWALSIVPEAKPKVRPIVFGGDCTLTPARLVVEEIDGDSVLRLQPGDIARPRTGIDYGRLMLEPGDGSVTKASLLARDSLDPTVPRHPYSYFPIDYSFFLCESHDRLTGNASFQDNLLQALLSVDR